MKKKLCLLVFCLLVLSSVCAFSEGVIPVEIADNAEARSGSGFRFEKNTLHITSPGDYLISGTLSDGQISVDCSADGKVTLYLNGVSVHNETGPAILIGECSPRAVIFSVDQTDNQLTNGNSLILTDGDEPDGVIFSRSDLTLDGAGSLTVTAGALNGIVSKDDLKIKGGILSVTAPQHGIKGKDFVEISDGSLQISAGRDGIKSSNKSDSSLGYIEIIGGSISIECGDDPLSFVTFCSITGGSLGIRLIR